MHSACCTSQVPCFLSCVLPSQPVSVAFPAYGCCLSSIWVLPVACGFSNLLPAYMHLSSAATTLAPSPPSHPLLDPLYACCIMQPSATMAGGMHASFATCSFLLVRVVLACSWPLPALLDGSSWLQMPNIHDDASTHSKYVCVACRCIVCLYLT